MLLIIRNILVVSTPKQKFRLLCTHSMTFVFHFRSLFLCLFFFAPWRSCARKMTANIWIMMTKLDLPRKMCNNKLYNSPEKRIDIKSDDRNYLFANKNYTNTCPTHTHTKWNHGIIFFSLNFIFLWFFFLQLFTKRRRSKK